MAASATALELAIPLEEVSRLDSPVCQGGTFGILIDMVGQIELTDSETAL
jgi:hypothetical protein